jgi:diguanylate cyclase (GGDEF)-like protein
MIGFLMFFFYLGFSVINQMNEAVIRERENAIYKRLAFVDKMTQINNRTAFEQKIHNMRQQDIVEPTYFCLVDMNNLKKINDTYGHTAGDNAIIEIARTLSKHFVDAECYRIGGDEFCIIAEGIQEKQIQEACDKVQTELNEKSRNLAYDVIIAMGYSKVEQGNLDECYNKADALMYENKKKLKGV